MGAFTCGIGSRWGNSKKKEKAVCIRRKKARKLILDGVEEGNDIVGNEEGVAQ